MHFISCSCRWNCHAFYQFALTNLQFLHLSFLLTLYMQVYSFSIHFLFIEPLVTSSRHHFFNHYYETLYFFRFHSSSQLSYSIYLFQAPFILIADLFLIPNSSKSLKNLPWFYRLQTLTIIHISTCLELSKNKFSLGLANLWRKLGDHNTA